MSGGGSSGTPATVPHDPYVALRHRDFRWYVISVFAMTLGSQLQAVVVGWQIYSITHDPLSLGLIGLAEALPFLAVALPAGYVADRWNRQKVYLGDVASSVCWQFVCCAGLALLERGADAARQGGRERHLRRDLRERHCSKPPSAGAAGDEFGAGAAITELENAIAWRSSTWQTAAVWWVRHLADFYMALRWRGDVVFR